MFAFRAIEVARLFRRRLYTEAWERGRCEQESRVEQWGPSGSESFQVVGNVWTVRCSRLSNKFEDFRASRPEAASRRTPFSQAINPARETIPLTFESHTWGNTREARHLDKPVAGRCLPQASAPRYLYSFERD